MGGGDDSLCKTEGIKEANESGRVGVGRGVKAKSEVSDNEETTFYGVSVF